MKRLIALVAGLVCLAVVALAQTSVVNPIPGYVWTYFGPTLGADWAPPTLSQSRGEIVAWPPDGPSAPTLPYNFTLPSGAPGISCVGTNSQCINELFQYACTNSYSLTINGQSYLGTNEAPGKVSSTVPIVVPACSFGSFHIHNLLMQITAANGLVFDSQEAGTFEYDSGVIFFVSTNGPAGNAVLFKPTNPVPTDGFTAISLNKFILPPIAAPEVALTSVVTFDMTGGGISSNFFEFLGDICGACNPVGFTSRGTYGISANNATPAHSFTANIFKINKVHDIQGDGIHIGFADDFVHAYGTNTWNINSIDLVGGNTAFSTYGSGDIININIAINDQGTFQHCVNFATANSMANTLRMNCKGYTGAPILDANAAAGGGGAGNDVNITDTSNGVEKIVVGPGRPWFKGALAAGGQGVISGVVAKVHLTAVQDTNAAWDAVNFVYQPQVGGTYEACWGLQSSAASYTGNQATSAYVIKSGTSPVAGTFQPQTYPGATQTISGSISGCNLFGMNGTSDALELDALIAATTPIVVGQAAGSPTYMTIRRIGP
jgi:hypothetical protein